MRWDVIRIIEYCLRSGQNDLIDEQKDPQKKKKREAEATVYSIYN